MGRKGKNYTEEFKKQIVALNNSGKSAGTIAKEYDVARSTISKWISDYSNTGSFKANDNRSDSENELLRLKKENARLEMENDILKQAALIMARK
ncbi:transposase [Clostridium algidicarnis DSM 15099]|uniref:Transposase n=1 Tax=Clostridium algidicarnis DSM 15099 TaxID=1121295 RepID=A0A2S6FUB4_9CLOT|nr:transposase [Clostridium algidicarnis DSM 15099]